MASTNPSPTIGDWYQDIVENQYFEVVAVDTRSGYIEIQYIDGEVSEIDHDSWRELNLVTAQPPEDADAAYEIPLEDGWADDHALNPNSMINPLGDIEPELFQGFDEY